MNRRVVSWIAAAVVAAGAFGYGAMAEAPPRTNADRVRALAEDFACPVCSGQSVGESDVPVAREIRRQIAVWVDEGRSDAYIRDQLVAAYDADIDYTPSGSGVTSLVWILPLLAGGGIAAVVVVMLKPARGSVPDSGAPPAAGSRRRWRNVAVWTVAVVVVAGAAGLLVARSSGSRTSDGSITGEIRSTARQKFFEAQQRLTDGDMAGAIAAYDEALEIQPSNVEALTYRGWLTSRQGDLAGAAPFLDDAVAVDPAYPDARLFRAIVALEEGDGAGAAEDLAVFDSLDPPPYAEQLLTQSRVRERVAEARDSAALQAVDALAALEERPAFSETALSVADALAAADALAGRGDLLEAVQLLDWVLESRPGDPDVLSGRGWLLVRSGDAELLALGVGYLDAALDVEPANARGLVYRAFARWQQGDIPEARADLDAFDALTHRPPDLVRLVEDQGLRDALSR
jgi:cytochrome c-type biogenesis protein CcmH